MSLQKRSFLAFLGMHARGGKLHLESLALGAVQETKSHSPAPREPGWPRNTNQMHPIFDTLSIIALVPIYNRLVVPVVRSVTAHQRGFTQLHQCQTKPNWIESGEDEGTSPPGNWGIPRQQYCWRRRRGSRLTPLCTADKTHKKIEVWVCFPTGVEI
jgi:hypothetical protein